MKLKVANCTNLCHGTSLALSSAQYALVLFIVKALTTIIISIEVLVRGGSIVIL